MDNNTHDEFDQRDHTVGAKCKLRVRQQRYDRNGKAVSEALDSLELPREGIDRAYAVVVNRIFNDKNILSEEVVTINSHLILGVFQKVIKTYPTVAANFSEPFEMESPFQMLYHYWDELDVYRKTCEDDKERMHLNLLFDFMDSSIGADRRRCLVQIQDNKIEFTKMWTIYRPGDLLVRFERGHPWLLKCVKTAYEENTSVGKWFEVHSTFTDFDGTNVGEAEIVTKILQKEKFASEHPCRIQDLKIYPRKNFLKEDESLERRLEERGKSFLRLTETCVKQYDGQAEYAKELPIDFYHPAMALWEMIWWPYNENGRVVIDRKTFQEDNELGAAGVKIPIDNPDTRLCPPFVYGYSLAVKAWCRFYLTHLDDVAWDSNSIDSLVMKKDQKALLQALVTSHKFPPNPRDQMKQKGKGLVLLLHGSPGSGKTLTAETCAEITQKALLSTSLAELNKENRPWYFERRLLEVLQYATIWKAIVLFDEADVFLEKRKADVADAATRNALVAIFLKHLEYFSGIVFLTTNRVDVFDSAMRSRIHLALGYKPPNDEMRKELWERSIQKAIGGDIDGEMRESLGTFVRYRLNGREISNAINTASTLARYEGARLQLKHIETVLNVRREFDLSLKHLGEETESSSISVLARRGTMMEDLVDEPEEI